jgi:dienelactone hydrolase
MHTEEIAYSFDGTEYVGYLAFDGERSGDLPAVLVCHGGGGLDQHSRDRADRLAALGYVAFALDYHGGGRPIPKSEVTSRVMPLHEDPERFCALGNAGLDVLTSVGVVDQTRLAAIGFCLGGTLALELARRGGAFKAIVGFHAPLDTTYPEGAHNIRGKVLVCLGADDPVVPAKQRIAFEEEMRAGGVDWEMQLYGRVAHSFTDPSVAADPARPLPARFQPVKGAEGAYIGYDQGADERSWRAMLELFDEVLR